MTDPAKLAKVLSPQLARWSSCFVGAEIVTGVDAILLAPICQRETDGGESKYLDVRGPSGRGDQGHGHGLMQIDDRFHASFIAAIGPDGVPLWKKPEWNILYAAEILAGNFLYFAGSEAAAVAAYNGSAKKIHDALISAGVLIPAANEACFEIADSFTTGKDYSRWVLAKRDLYRTAYAAL